MAVDTLRVRPGPTEPAAPGPLADAQRLAERIVAAAHSDAARIVADARAAAEQRHRALVTRTAEVSSRGDASLAAVLEAAAARAAERRTRGERRSLRVLAEAEGEAAAIRSAAAEAAAELTTRLERRRARLERELQDAVALRDRAARTAERRIRTLGSAGSRLSARPRGRLVAVALVAAAAVGVAAGVALSGLGSSAPRVPAQTVARVAAAPAAPRRCPIPARYRPAFVAAARRERLPLALLASLAHTESRFQTGAQSGLGAVGLMQVLPSTAAALGIDASTPAGNIRAGARFLRLMIDEFSSTYIGIAAYNAGPTAVLNGTLGTETLAYVRDVTSSWHALAGCK